MKFSNHKKTKGFTLVEMMVAVFVFSVVMVLSTGAIFSIVNANKTSQALKSVMDNLSSALDTMSRDIRYGTVYNCKNTNPPGDFVTSHSCNGQDGDTGGTVFAFVDKNINNVIYAFEPTLTAVDSAEAIFKCVDRIADDKCIRLTAPEVHIKGMHFYVSGAEATEAGQPQVLMVISGYAQAGVNKSYFNIETMVDQRSLTCKDSMHSLGICKYPSELPTIND
jgi:prepilin-type N-terminal cleavage/methylation domain-containing protein